MPKLKHKKPKSGVIHARIDPKLRYGLDLVARQQHFSVSDAIVQAVVAYLDSKGISTRSAGKTLSVLDQLWSEKQITRIGNLTRLVPQLATAEDFMIIEIVSNACKYFLEKDPPIIVPDLYENDFFERNIDLIRRIVLKEESFDSLIKAMEEDEGIKALKPA